MNDQQRDASQAHPLNGSEPTAGGTGAWQAAAPVQGPYQGTSAAGGAAPAAGQPYTGQATYSQQPQQTQAQPGYGGATQQTQQQAGAQPYAGQTAYAQQPPQSQQPYAGQQTYGENGMPQQAPVGYPSPEPPRKKRTGLYVGIGIAAVVIVALVVALGAFVVPGLLGSDEPLEEERIEQKDRDDPADSVDEPQGSGDADASSEDTVRAEATAVLDQLANADPEMLERIGSIVSEGFQNQMDFTLENCGVNPIDYASAMLEGFTYEINSVHVGDDSAIVTATIDCRDVFSFIDIFNGMLETYVNSEAYQTSSIEEDMERIGYMFMESARTAEMWGGYPLTLDFTRSGDTWSIDDDAWESELDYLFDVE